MSGHDYWKRVDELFRLAVEAPVEARAALLDALGADEAAIRDEVASLLRSRDASADFLEQPVAEAINELDPNVGRTIGAYRLVGHLGSGGMGAVYDAERADGAYEQRVAIKFIRGQLVDPELQARFRRERQILASLSHPNIARLLDGGVLEDGRPYLVMEHVEGRPLLAHCDERRLSIDERLQLFDRICEAVQHAHQNLVVHRDLKPGNIIVSAAGEPILLDFGIAAVLEGGDAQGSATATMHRRYTPQYASPEQVRGEPVTTATDVYSLGIMLYELLAGRRPYEVDGTDPGSDTRVICETTPPLPSRRLDEAPGPDIAAARATDVTRLRRRLRGDLDTIVMTALRKEPARRYASAEALLEDLRRFRAGLPVSARPDTRAYRSRKFVRRHRFGVAAGVLVALALVAGIIGTSWQARLAEQQRQSAESALATSDTVGRFLRSILTAAQPRQAGQDVTMREALDAATARIENELGDEPEVEARVRVAIGETFRSLGALVEAEAQLVRGEALSREVFGPDDAETAYAMHELAILRGDQGRFDDAIRLYESALAIRKATLGPDAGATTETRNSLALVLNHLERHTEALDHLEGVVDARRERLGPTHPATLVARNNLAVTLTKLERYDEAIEIQERVYADQEASLGVDHIDTLISANDLAAAFQRTGRRAEAIPWYERAIAGLSAQLPAGSMDVVIPKMNLGRLLGELDRHDAARDLLLATLPDAVAQLGDDHFVVAVLRSTAAEQLLALGDHEAAAGLAERAHAVLVEIYGPDNGFTRAAERALEEARAAGDAP